MLAVSYGRRLKSIRDHLDMSGQLFGDALGVSKQTISAVENGERGLSTEMIQQVVECFGVDPRWFFGQIDRIEDAFVHNRETPGVSSVEALELQVRKLGDTVTQMQDHVSPADRLDEVARRVIVHPPLHKFVKMIYTQDATVLEKLSALVYGYLARDAEGSGKKGRAASA